MRVPADKLDGVMADLKKLGRVESESQRGEEVSKQYTDPEARLTNARNAEHRLTDLLRQRTGKLADVLAVELEINRVRGEIERMDAEKKGLLNRVDFATVNVKVTEDYKAQLDIAPETQPVSKCGGRGIQEYGRGPVQRGAVAGFVWPQPSDLGFTPVLPGSLRVEEVARAVGHG